MKVIQLTDIHLTQRREKTIFDVNLYDNFDIICEEIRRIQTITEIELIIVSGDITNDGDTDAYSYFLNKMESLNTPYIAIPGNHDLKEKFNISLAEIKPKYHITSREYNRDNWYITGIDTVVEGEDYGFITKTNLAELEKRIIENSHFNIALFMHHHVKSVGTPIVDSCMLENANALLALCEKYKIKFIGCGHAHTSRIWHKNEMTISVAPAVSFQWLLGTDTVKTAKGFGFNIIDFSTDLSVVSCSY
ncbi:metallophosphoesterase family protein [Xenorhabdus budapestensis]|uniref:Cyclic 3',5'-adenosine monophosphate phosphodiesterase n=1 Tax=Xenorhabdus budapestensis TaxID=290110 RepID=A0A2D0J0J2_XENBU|nr:metallophosphoesterase [Xenorhabdus budapestensis]PHM27783.1 cyclic 3',5'-adenosine monophosphate phosphodiesterase [Xenorhabdus budapestensis]QTL38443.1 metallophosphoesterase [Xenorhabdus budapestensis]